MEGIQRRFKLAITYIWFDQNPFTSPHYFIKITIITYLLKFYKFNKNAKLMIINQFCFRHKFFIFAIKQEITVSAYVFA